MNRTFADLQLLGGFVFMVEKLRKLKEIYQRKTIINSMEKQKTKSHTREIHLIVALYGVWYDKKYI